MSVVVKTSIAPAAALPAVRKTLQTIDPDLPVGAGTTMSFVEERRWAHGVFRCCC